MGYLFWGFLFTTFDYLMKIRSLHVGIVPDFLGYMLFVAGCKAMISKSEKFRNVYKACAVALFVSAAKYVADLFGVTGSFSPVVAAVVDVVYVAMKMYVAFVIIKAYKDIESTTRIDLRTQKLFNTNIVMFAFAFFKAIRPTGTIGGVVYIIAFFGALLMPAVFMVHEYDAYMNYKGNVLMK